jgi:hypothetical protein
MLSVFWVNTNSLKEYIRDKQTFCVHFANEHARWFALVTCRYHQNPSFPVVWCRVSMRSRNTNCCDAVGFGVQDRICRWSHCVVYEDGEVETVSEKEQRTLLKSNFLGSVVTGNCNSGSYLPGQYM